MWLKLKKLSGFILCVTKSFADNKNITKVTTKNDKIFGKFFIRYAIGVSEPNILYFCCLD